MGGGASFPLPVVYRTAILPKPTVLQQAVYGRLPYQMPSSTDIEEEMFIDRATDIYYNVVSSDTLITVTDAYKTLDSITASNVNSISDKLLPALPNVSPNTIKIPTGCIYDNNGVKTSNYTGNYLYTTRSYTETIDFTDDTPPQTRRNPTRPSPITNSVTTVTVTGPLSVTGTSPSLANILAFCVDSTGNIYIIQSNRNVSVSKLTISNNAYSMSSYAGIATAGSVDGPVSTASFKDITDMNIRGGNIYVMDSITNGTKIRMINTESIVSTPIASITKGNQGLYNKFEIDSNGNFFVFNKFYIQKITSSGTITPFAGSDSQSSTAVAGTGTDARFLDIKYMCVDSTNNIYVVDKNTIRKITSSGVVSTPYIMFNKSGIPVTFSNITGLCVDSKGVLYITTTQANYNNRIIQLNVVPSMDVVIASIFAGTGAATSLAGNDTTATFTNPTLMTVDPAKNIYVLDGTNLRKITIGITNVVVA